MRKALCTILGTLLLPVCVHCQTLNASYNLPRPGDKLMKCQITTIQPNRGGIQQIWDFTEIKLRDADYELKYETQGNDTIIATEHHTMYYYQKSGDSLFCVGYENPTTYIVYQNPELLFAYPIFQERTIYDYFEGKGNYCNYLDIHLCGKTTITADASGILILPGGDTIQNVLRTYSRKYIHQRMQPLSKINNMLSTDTISFIIDADSIDYLIANDSIHLETKTWRWYADGYRYPIIETVISVVYKFGIPHEHLSTSFAYLPSEQYYNLSYDTKNQERVNLNQERIWKMSNPLNGNITQNAPINYKLYTDREGYLNVDYQLEQNNKVSLLLYDLEGRQLFAKHYISQSYGHYHEIVNMEGQPNGKYLLILTVGDKKYIEKIVKH